MSYVKEINIQNNKYYEILRYSYNINLICSIVQYNCKITITENKFIISSNLLDSTNKAYILLLDEFAIPKFLFAESIFFFIFKYLILKKLSFSGKLLSL